MTQGARASRTGFPSGWRPELILPVGRPTRIEQNTDADAAAEARKGATFTHYTPRWHCQFSLIQAVIVVASQPVNGYILLYRNCEVVNESPRVVETVA